MDPFYAVHLCLTKKVRTGNISCNCNNDSIEPKIHTETYVMQTFMLNIFRYRSKLCITVKYFVKFFRKYLRVPSFRFLVELTDVRGKLTDTEATANLADNRAAEVSAIQEVLMSKADEIASLITKCDTMTENEKGYISSFLHFCNQSLN